MLSRREFLAAASAATVALTSRPAGASANSGSRFQLGGFTKALQHLSFEELAQVSAEIGWDGIELPVRPGGHIEPETAADELPRAAEAMRGRGQRILVLATGVTRPDQPHAETLLRTAAKLGIRQYRIGYWKYDLSKPLRPQLAEIKPQLRDLAALNRELGMCGLFQNHSNYNFVGGPVWDMHQLIRDLDPQHMAAHFDIGHATVEGGYAWKINYRLMEPRVGGVIVKDFTWRRTDDGWKAVWGPLGKGMIRPEFFKLLKASRFRGPVTMHFEYELDADTQDEYGRKLVQAMKQDLSQLRAWLA